MILKAFERIYQKNRLLNWNSPKGQTPPLKIKIFSNPPPYKYFWKIWDPPPLNIGVVETMVRKNELSISVITSYLRNTEYYNSYNEQILCHFCIVIASFP